MDYVLGKQQKMQLQRQQSHGNPRQPIPMQHAKHYNGYHNPLLPPPHLSGDPPSYPPLALRGQPGELRRVKVTRTKSCGPFIPIQQNLADQLYPDSSPPPPLPHHHHQQSDPHPPRHLPPNPAQEGHLEEATRSLHKALALEGLRDWYMRNTLGPSQNNSKVNAGVNTKVTGVKGGVKGQDNGGGALQRRRTTHGGPTQPSAYQAETHHQYALPPQLPHSATFHNLPMHGRSVDTFLYQDSFPSQKHEMPLKEPITEQPSPGTLV